jgi:hypothetical protein
MPARLLFVAVSCTALLLLAVPAHAEVNISINIGPPPVVLAAPPPLVAVPGTAVSYAPGVDFNLFVFGGRFYSLHGGVWFHASTVKGPWAMLAPERVPAPVLAVPVAYYKVPPGQAKKMDSGMPPGHTNSGKKGKKGHDR